jgi:hypothetical protein
MNGFIKKFSEVIKIAWKPSDIVISECRDLKNLLRKMVILWLMIPQMLFMKQLTRS